MASKTKGLDQMRLRRRLNHRNICTEDTQAHRQASCTLFSRQEERLWEGGRPPVRIRRLFTPLMALAKCRGHAYALPGISMHRCIGENL